MSRLRTFQGAEVIRVLGPDMFEAKVDLGFDIEHARRLRLLGVDADSLRDMNQDQIRRTCEFQRGRIEGKVVSLKVQRKGEHYYARVLYGNDETDLLEEMVAQGLVKKFERNGTNGDG